MTAVGGLFFPLAAQLGLPARSTVTTKVLQKAIWAGANNGSYQLASEALAELAGIQLAPKQIRRLVMQVGQERLAERDAAVEQLQHMPLPQRRAGSQAADPPELAVISMDGGRYQRRDHFRGAAAVPSNASEPVPAPRGKHWRETKVGSLLSMASPVHADDPAPEFPEWLASSSAISELAKIADKTGGSAASAVGCEQGPPPVMVEYEPPKLLARDVVASSDEGDVFAWQLEARAWQLGFPAAPRQAFVADGLAVNWKVAREHFPRATPILDLMHALSYAWSAAAAVDGGASYRTWAEWIWQGNVSRVLADLEQQQARLGEPPPQADEGDPRQRVQRALTYYRNNHTRMQYPKYRQRGLPLTSSHIESTIKQINQRIKGTEKFWSRPSGDAVLQLRADALSDSDPLTSFWRRWQADQIGANCYRTAA